MRHCMTQLIQHFEDGFVALASRTRLASRGLYFKLKSLAVCQLIEGLQVTCFELAVRSARCHPTNLFV